MPDIDIYPSPYIVHSFKQQLSNTTLGKEYIKMT